MSVFNTKRKKHHTESRMFLDGGVNVQRYDTLKYRTFDKLTDKQLARVVHSKKFIGDYNGLVSAQSPANQSSSAWVAHMVEWLKKDPDNFTKRPMQEYLDDEQAPRF